MVYFKRERERKKRKERDREKIQELDVKKDDSFVTMLSCAVRHRGKNEIEGWVSFFSLSLSQSLFKLELMSFSFLNSEVLFYKFFFFFFFQFSRCIK